ncbi:adenylyltransferase/cytidyltransferase family protein [Gammaproteobacteria bacterium]|nr:adenylyltransferase/cytidyltransferase family protein [Gammaproteobacteria bacterium]
MSIKISVVSGGFDPIHRGHIEYFKEAAKIGDKLVVALNSDKWLIDKKGKYFMPFSERKVVIENLEMVDLVVDFEDDDMGSCCNALKKLKEIYPNDEIIFCNGGDRKETNIPEMSVNGISFEFSVGGDEKLNSSSWILKDFQFDFEKRIWGKFFNLYIDNRLKLKELIVDPGKGMSFQKHKYRNEIWFVSKGKCLVNFSEEDPDNYNEFLLETEQTFHVPIDAWHQITNPYDKPCHIIEIQYGEQTSEEDIVRLRYYAENEKILNQ